MSIQDINSVLSGSKSPESLDPFDLSFLLLSGHYKLSFDLSHHERLVKAVRALPPYWAESRVLVKILQESWDYLSEKFRDLITEPFDFKAREVDKKKFKAALKELSNIGSLVWEDVGDKSADVLRGVVEASEKASKIDSKRPIEKAATDPQPWQEVLSDRSRDQLRAFVETYPDRILRPELERQLELFENVALGTSLDTLQMRLERATRSENYWEGMSTLQVGRTWNTAALEVANEQQVTDFQVVSQGDDDVCDVCFFLDGRIFELKPALTRARKMFEETDPERIADAYPFPRYPDLDRKGYEEIRSSGHNTPPYHPHCRCQIEYIFSDVDIERIEPDSKLEGPAIQKELYGFKVSEKGVVEFDFDYFDGPEEAKSWVEESLTKNGYNTYLIEDDDLQFQAATLRMLDKHAPLKEKLYYLSNETLRGAGGQATDYGEIILNDRISFRPLGKKRVSKDYVASLKEKRKTWQESYEENQKWAKKADDPTAKKFFSGAARGDRKAIAKLNREIKLAEKGKFAFFDASTVSTSKHVQSQGLSTLIHEYGHVWHHQFDTKVKKEFGVNIIWGYGRDSKAHKALCRKYRVTEYCKRSWMECFAENFSLYFQGEIEEMHPDFIRFFDKQFPTINFGKRLRPEIYTKPQKVNSKKIGPKKVPKEAKQTSAGMAKGIPDGRFDVLSNKRKAQK